MFWTDLFREAVGLGIPDIEEGEVKHDPRELGEIQNP